MNRWITFVFCGLFICSCLLACVEEEASAPASPNNTTAAKPPAQKVPPPAEVQEEEPVEEYVYVSKGRRDPFVPLSRIRKPIADANIEEPATPLQKYDVKQFKLIGLIVGRGDPKAMVTAPDGKSYLLSKGLKIGKNNGVILDITSEAVIIEEKYYDFSGNVIENIQEISVPSREGV